MNLRVRRFAQHLGAQELRELELAVAALWFIGHEEGHSRDITVKEIIAFLEQHRLRTGINPSRLSQNLKANGDVIRGTSLHTYRMKAGADQRLFQEYALFTERSEADVNDTLLSNRLSLGGRRHFEQIRLQANGCFESGFFDGAAVMCRRLVELLLIETFASKGKLSAISDAKGDLVSFGEMIDTAKSGLHIKLSRTSPKTLDRIKAIGDAAAHHRFYLTTRQDIESLNPSLSHLLADLAGISGL